MMKSLIAYLLLIPASYASNAGTMFEGFYRIERNGYHNGYLIQRLYRDPKSQRLTLTTYVRTMQNGKEVSERIKAESTTGKVTPIASEYNGQVLGRPARVQAKFRSTASVDSVEVYGSGAKAPKETRRVFHPSFLNSMVFYVADLAKFHVEKSYGYLAFSEEQGRTSLGTLRLVDERTISGARILQVEDNYLGQRIENFLSESGESLGARNRADRTVVRWVPSLQVAAGKMKVPKDEITRLFGNMPKGQANAWVGVQGFDSASIMASFTKPGYSKSKNVLERKTSVANMPVKNL